MDTKRVRIALEVVAGLIPGQPIAEYTRRFIITSDIWYLENEWKDKPKEAQIEIMKQYGAAAEYARSLMNPQLCNWVRLDWIYF